MNVFYVPSISGNFAALNEEESKHCIRVLRLKREDKISLVDGMGGFYQAVITKPDPSKCELRIITSSKEFGKRKYKLHISIAPTKSQERFEWFLEKATEIGIDKITPLICQRSERDSIKYERSIKIMISAMKQSKKAYLPVLSKETLFTDFIKSESDAEKYIAHCQNKNITLLKNWHDFQNVCILIGPEGDFSTEEIQLAKQFDYKETSLGHSTYRTETAGIIACHTIYLLNQK